MIEGLITNRKTSLRLLIFCIITCGFIMKREYCGQLNSLIVTKSKIFIKSLDELYKKLDRTKPYFKSNSQIFFKLKSLNHTKWNAILSKRAEYTNLGKFMEEKLDEILSGNAVAIASASKIENQIKIYSDFNLKMIEVEEEDSFQDIQEVRFPIWKDSLKLEKLYRM